MPCSGNHDNLVNAKDTKQQIRILVTDKNADQALAAWFSETIRLIKDRRSKIVCQSAWKMVAQSMSG